jgi:hypothetical protein
MKAAREFIASLSPFLKFAVTGGLLVSLWQIAFLSRGVLLIEEYRDAAGAGLHLVGGAENFSTGYPAVIAFIAALISLWVSFCWVRRYAVGAITVLFLGSNPFQIAEVYRSASAYSWPITCAILLLAGSIPFFYRRLNVWFAFSYALLAGMILGGLALVRPECLFLVASVCGVFWFFSELDLRKRLGGIALHLGGVALVLASCSSYLESRIEIKRHFWHSMYIGLGDFDQKYGHVPLDEQAYLVASDVASEDILNTPAYELLMAKLFAMRVSGDPIWYAGILIRRTLRMLTDTTPLSVQLGSYRIVAHWSGLFWLLALGLAFYGRKKRDIGLLLFALPMSLSALLLYSGEGQTFYSLSHLMAATVLVSWLLETSYAQDIQRKFFWKPVNPGSFK